MPKLNSRPRLREKGPSALSVQQNSLLNKHRLLPAHYPKTHERRAPKLLHVGRRISAIQGRRVGEWLEQHRSASGERVIRSSRTHGCDRAAASTSPGEVDGGRERVPCDPGSSNQAGRRALTAEIEVRRLVPELYEGEWLNCGERLFHTQEVAGSSPASPITCGRSSAR